MAKTLLQLIQKAADELGIPTPAQIIGAQDDQAKQLLALANREGKDFSQAANGEGGWQNLHKEYTFTTNSITTTGTLTANSYIVTGILSTAGLVAGTWACTGNGTGTTSNVIASVDSPTQVTLKLPASASGTQDLTFGQIAYDLPSDFQYFVYASFWDNSYKWQLLGPIQAQEKQILRYGVIASGPRRKFYVRVNKLWIDPVPGTSGQIIAYDYFSNGWCQSQSGAPQTEWLADSDTYSLDEDCFILGLKWRWRRAKGLDYGQEYADYMNDMQRVMGRDGGKRDLPLVGGSYGNLHLLDESNIPETGYGNIIQ